MVDVTFNTQETVPGFGLNWTIANISTVLHTHPTVATSTDLRWQGGSGTDTWQGDITGTGMTPVLVGGLLTDVTSGTISSLVSHDLINGLVTDITLTNVNDDAGKFFDLVFAKNWKGLFAYITQGADHVVGGNTNDTINGGGGSDRLEGGGGADRLMGGIGADTLLGGLGNDTLTGGAGHDLLTGGIGADEFVYNTAIKAADFDTITDFTHGVDHIALLSTAIAGLGAAGSLDPTHFHIGAVALTAAEVIIYNSATGWVNYDADGSGAGAAVHLAHLHTGLALAATDFLVL